MLVFCNKQHSFTGLNGSWSVANPLQNKKVKKDVCISVSNRKEGKKIHLCIYSNNGFLQSTINVQYLQYSGILGKTT